MGPAVAPGEAVIGTRKGKSSASRRCSRPRHNGVRVAAAAVLDGHRAHALRLAVTKYRRREQGKPGHSQLNRPQRR